MTAPAPKPIRRVLVANRGEIAVRVIRALREMEIASVAVHSDADAAALHVRLADRAIPIGPGPAKQSYLDGDKIVRAALADGCDAIHPGYGFLSENAAFAGACEAAGVTFIGPRSETIARMGSKTRARELMSAAGVPVLPGSGDVFTVADAVTAAERAGYPVILKAAAGGGGIGMKVCRSREELEKDFAGVQSRAATVFKSDAILVERYLERPRHVEVQVLGDRAGNVVHLFERECTIQRRHQKVIEETPSPALDDAVRADLLARAAAGARSVGYENAGTLEFLYDPAARGFYFMEMNTRLQVEHPVTEMTTGIDLVHAQVRVAEGAPLPLAQADIRRSGHAIELRVYAEDPARGFAPQPGKLGAVEWPSGEGIRCDAGYAAGDVVPPFYDPLLAKIVAHGPARLEAIDRARAALEGTRLEGIRTNLGLLARILADTQFRSGDFHTGFLTERKDLLA